MYAYSGSSGLSVSKAKFRASDVRFIERPSGEPILSYGLLLVFLLFLYANPALLFPALDDLRPTQLVAVAALGMLFIEKMAGRQSLNLVWPESPLILAFLGAAGLSCLTALWSRYALENLQDLAKFVAVYFLIVNCVSSEKRLGATIWAMVIGGLFPALGAAHNYWNSAVVEGRTAWIGIFGNPNDLAASLVLLVPLAVAVGSDLRPWLRPAAWAMVAALIAAILLTFSRGGILGLIAVLVMLALHHGSGTRRVLTMILLVGSLLFISFFWSRGEGFSHLSQDFTAHQRLTTIQVGLAMFQDHPLFGVGLGCSVIGWPLYAPPNLSNKWLHNHNTFVQVLSETGIAGFIPFALLLIAALRDARRVAASCQQFGRERMARLSAALEVSLWGFLVCAMAGGMALTWFPYLLIGAVSAAKNVAPGEPADSHAIEN